MYIALAFILGILACAIIMYVMSLKETITRQKTQIQDLESQLKQLLSDRPNSDSVHH
jgi:uncharacterized protein YoxC